MIFSLIIFFTLIKLKNHSHMIEFHKTKLEERIGRKIERNIGRGLLRIEFFLLDRLTLFTKRIKVNDESIYTITK